MVSEQGKCLTALKAAGSSLSKVEYLVPTPDSFLGVERQQLPAPSGQLLKHAPCVCVGGVRCEGEHIVRGAMRHRYRSRQGPYRRRYGAESGGKFGAPYTGGGFRFGEQFLRLRVQHLAADWVDQQPVGGQEI